LSSDLRLRQALILVLLALLSINVLGCATTPSTRSQDSSKKVKELNREALKHYAGGDFEKALRIWNAALAKKPGSAKILFNLGLGHFALQQFDKSREAFTESLKHDQDFVPALINRALALNQMGENRRASRDLEKAAQVAPEDPLVKFNQGVLAASQAEYAQAIEHYSAALELRPGLAPAWNNRGICYLETGDYSQAASDFTRAIKVREESATYYFNRAVAWEGFSRFDEAVSDYTKAVSFEPDLAPAYYNRGLLRINLHRRQRGCRDLEQACRLGMCEQLRLLQAQGVCPLPDDGENLSELQNRPTPQKARPTPAHSAIASSESPRGTTQSTRTDNAGQQSVAQNLDNGLAPDKASHSQRPDQGPSSSTSQAVLEKTKRSGQSSASEKQSTVSVAEVRQQEPEVMAPSKEEENNAGVIVTSKSSEPGDRDLSKTSAQEDDLAPGKLYTNALRTLRKDKHYAQAREQLVNFISNFPKHPYAPNAYYWLGETYYVQKDYSKSISIFEIGAKRFPDHAKAPDCLLKAGLAYISIEEKSKARDQFQRLISEYPSSSSSRIAKRKLTTLQ